MQKMASHDTLRELELYKALFNGAHDAMFIMDKQGIFSDVNTRACRIFGCSREILKGQKADVLFHDFFEQLTLSLILDLAKNPSRRIELFLEKNKDVFCFEVRAESYADFILLRFRNISEKKKTEGELKESRDQFARFMEYLPAIAFLKDHEGKTLYVNPYFSEILGPIPLNTSVLELYPEEIARKMMEDDLQVFEQGQIIRIEKVPDKKGKIRSFQTIKFRMNREGKMPLLGGFAIDITDQLKAQEELHKKNEELMRFTYTVSHDLKSPLVTILSFLGYLEKDIQSRNDERIRSDIGFIRNAADKMGGLLQDLLEFSRIGRKMSVYETVPMKDLISEALKLVAGRIEEKKAQICVEAGDIILYGEKRRLIEVFQNLLDNALKFADNTRLPFITIGVKEESSGAKVIFIRDNGIGIDPRYHSQLFNLFEKLDPKTEGTGMGLALVKRIVEVHGGKIWLESEGTDKGTTFYFTLSDKPVRMNESQQD